MRGDKGARMANAMAVVAGRGSRPCDVCARKRSRWYCAADEAYLCEACDSSVHAANALAFRHERVRLTPSGAPMKMERRNVNHGEHPSAPNSKKKLKILRPAPNPCGDQISGSPAFKSPQQQFHNSGLREVKLESHPPNYTINDADHDGSDDHFTAEELTGNANVLDETLPSMCPPSYDGSNNPDRSSHVLTNRGEPQDFAHDFLVSDPNDPNNNFGTGIRGSGTFGANICSAGGGEGAEEGVEDDQDEDDAEDDGVENDWMDGPDLANRDLSDDDEYCIDPSALRDSVSAGASDQSVALYSHDEKPVLVSCGIPSSQMGKAFKNMAGQQEWVKVEEGYPNYGVAPQQALANSSARKIEGLSMSDSDLRQVPSLRLNYEDVLSSWPDRSFRCMDDGSGSQLVPGDDTNSDLGSCYDLGLVPDLSSGGGGIDGGSGQFPHIYGGCGPGGGAGGAGDDGGANVGNAREFKVNRYREKRRTRKFSKKIRYEVRKVNAERRPRMKGRFVKRSPSRET